MEASAEKKYGHFAVVAQTGLLLTYSIPLEFQNCLTGKLCVVPVRQGHVVKTMVGMFLEFCPKPDFLCQDILGFVPGEICFSPLLVSFIFWISDYYLLSFEKAVHLLAPRFIWDQKKHLLLKKRLENLKKVVLSKDDVGKEIVLNESQQTAYENILNNNLLPTLLHGVTGSGKTEVYLKLAQKVIQNGKKVLILVPEIVLTPQMGTRFFAVFGKKLAVLHSGLTPKDHMQQWLGVYSGNYDVVLGVRTSVFCPLEKIGLIIVDEEHDSSYKSNEFPTYHARDLAVVRARMEHAYCVLGSATPSLETMYAVKNGKYALTEMTSKFSSSENEYHVVDGREEFTMPDYMKKNPFLKLSRIDFFEDEFHISKTILNLLSENKRKNEQSMILLNRRGYVNYSVCVSCKNPLSCPSCSVTTTLHQKGTLEICHYCGFQTPKRKFCPHCGSNSFANKGIGTQNLEIQLQHLLPDLRFDRLDRDVLTSHSRLSKIVENFQTGQTDCLIGTQLLAKGHDFPNVTLVIILHLEDALFLPDFRAGERTFQLLLQAMGRAGRGSKPGQIVLQSFIQTHPVVQYALNQDFNGFLERELKLRSLAWNPPYCRQILFEIRHKIKDKALDLAHMLKQQLIDFWKQQDILSTHIRLAGPYPATIERLSDEYRMQLCVNFVRTWHPKKIVPKQFLEQKEFVRYLRVDVDPISFL